MILGSLPATLRRSGLYILFSCDFYYILFGKSHRAQARNLKAVSDWVQVCLDKTQGRHVGSCDMEAPGVGRP